MVLKSCLSRDRVLGTDQKKSRRWDEIVNTMSSLANQIICNDKVKVHVKSVFEPSSLSGWSLSRFP